MPGDAAGVTGNDDHDELDERSKPVSTAPSGDGPQEIVDAARQEAEIPADETGEG